MELLTDKGAVRELDLASAFRQRKKVTALTGEGQPDGTLCPNH